MLGDVQIAEPRALIAFTGARVIDQTIREKLPEGAQRAEYLKERGMVDMIVHRHDLRPTIARLCRLLMKAKQDARSGLTDGIAKPGSRPVLRAAHEGTSASQ